MLFQFLPRLSSDDYAALEASIREHGVQVPVVLDEHGSVIDGHHRKEIADRLGVDFPKRTKTGLSETQKRTLALSLNVDRRHLTRDQKRALVRASLIADPQLSDREHGTRVGVDGKTVATVRAELEATAEIPQSETRVSADGRSRPATYKRTETTKTTEEVTADPVTGEVIEPGAAQVPDAVTAPVEATPTPPRAVTGLDGKTYPVKPTPKPAEDPALQNAEAMSKDVARSLMSLSGMQYPAHRNRVITEWWPAGKDAVPPDWVALFQPGPIRDIATWLWQLADELEGRS